MNRIVPHSVTPPMLDLDTNYSTSNSRNWRGGGCLIAILLMNIKLYSHCSKFSKMKKRLLLFLHFKESFFTIQNQTLDQISNLSFKETGPHSLPLWSSFEHQSRTNGRNDYLSVDYLSFNYFQTNSMFDAFLFLMLAVVYLYLRYSLLQQHEMF